MVTLLNQPMGGNEMPRFGGIATMMRLPFVENPAGLDVGFVGVPLDIGTSNRSGTRFGPRQIRAESVLLRPYNMATRAAPFDSLQVADIGDIALNPYNLLDSVRLIEESYDRIYATGCKTISMGGDHTMTLPILRSIFKTYGKVGLIHVDAHADVNDTMNGEKIAHGTPFRRAFEEGLLDPQRVVQAEECWYQSLAPLMAEVRAQMGDGPVYLTFDIDGLDPAFAPGTGTPEIGGLSVQQGMEIIRGAKGLNIASADIVEVSPPYDQAGTTALVAANLAYEMLCVFPGVKYRA